jgi:dihydroorotate dehydrogenase (NAD+) catalytic subunit
MILAGATAVEVGTANLIDPYRSKTIVEDLPEVMQKYKIQNLKEIIGGAHYGD